MKHCRGDQTSQDTVAWRNTSLTAKRGTGLWADLGLDLATLLDGAGCIRYASQGWPHHCIGGKVPELLISALCRSLIRSFHQTFSCGVYPIKTWMPSLCDSIQHFCGKKWSMLSTHHQRLKGNCGCQVEICWHVTHAKRRSADESFCESSGQAVSLLRFGSVLWW